MLKLFAKIKNILSGKKTASAKNKTSSNKASSSIPPSRDHSFKRSRPGERKHGTKRSDVSDKRTSNNFEKRAPRQQSRGADPTSRDGSSRRHDRRGGAYDVRHNSRDNSSRDIVVTKEAPVTEPVVASTPWNPAEFAVEPAEGKVRFHDFNLPEPIMHAIFDLGFKYCTPIQSASLEKSLAGANVAGRAQTGTGKTAAYLLTVLTRHLRGQFEPGKAESEKTTDNAAETAINEPARSSVTPGMPRALVIAPTRELCVQIARDAQSLGKYCGLRSMAVFGGMDYAKQSRELLDFPIDLLAATPGRLLDFQRSHIVDLSHIDTLVIDEADRMLDMGFIPDVRRIIHCLPVKRQTLLYSATLNDDVMRLASQWMPDPVKIEIEPEQVSSSTIDQKVLIVTSNQKFTVLCHLLDKYAGQRVLVFANRRVSTESLAENLRHYGHECELLSGDVSQVHRMKVIDSFRSGDTKLVVATDVAGRGLHIADIGLVVNFELPYEAEDYVHRIGRTGRAGKVGTAVSFACEDESFVIPDIEKYLGEELHCIQPEEYLLAPLERPQRSHQRRDHRPAENASTSTAMPEEKSVVPEQSSVATAEATALVAEATASAVQTAAAVVDPQASSTVDSQPADVKPSPVKSSRGHSSEDRTRQSRMERRVAGASKPVAVVPTAHGIREQIWTPGSSAK